MPRDGYILIIEDDDLIRDLLARWLMEAGYDVVIGRKGTHIPDQCPALVIANVPSPQHADIYIKTLRRLHTAPLLLVSARFRSGLGTSEAAARRFNVKRILPKPYSREELLAAVSEAIDGA